MEPIEEDGAETTIVKAQKLTEHEGHLRARDYDDVTQEFVITAVDDYRCHAPNTFGTVNMEHTVNLRLSWSER